MSDGYQTKLFEWPDYVIFVGTLVISLGIGVYYAVTGGRQKTTSEYLMGNRSLGVIPVALSMFMSFISAILVLGNTAEVYTYGIQGMLQAVGSSIAYATSAVVFVPLFFPLKITSSFEYLRRRFNSDAVKLTGTILLMTSQVFYMGIAMFSPSTAISAVSPIPTWAAIVSTGVVATIYTTIGGMKAVVWTDVFQGLVLMVGLLVVLIRGAIEVGGLGTVFETAQRAGRLNISFSPDPTLRMTFWSAIIGRLLSSMQTTGTAQASVQRYCALPTITKAKISVFFNIPCLLFVYALTIMVGLVVFTHYENIGCDPLRTNVIANQNQLLPFFITNVLRQPGLSGLFVAVLFSGALSSISSSLNALSAVTWSDILSKKYGHIPESKKALVTKILVFIYGIIAISFAFIASNIGGHVLQASQTFVGGVGGPLFGMFVLAAFFPFTNWKGTVVGAFVGLAVSLSMAITNSINTPHVERLPVNTSLCLAYGVNITKDIPANPDLPPILRLSFLWFSTIATGTTVTIGIVVSLLTGPMNPKKLNPLLVVPYFERIFCCCPSLFKVFRCGVDYDAVTLDETGHVINKEIDEKTEDSSIESGVKISETSKNTQIFALTQANSPFYENSISSNGIKQDNHHEKQSNGVLSEKL